MDHLDAIERLLTQEAISGGLTWREDLPKIKENALALDALKPFGRARDESAVEVNGMYRGCEDFCAVYAMGDALGLQFLWAAVDYIAREVDQAVRGDVSNASGFAYRYGEDGIAALLAVLRGSAQYISVQHRRAETEDEDGQAITAPVGTDDQRFEEAGFVRCDPADENATLITVMDLDEEAFADLDELVQAKDTAARRAYRAAPAPLQSITLERTP
jgi:DnaJ-domain-containing protein 1